MFLARFSITGFLMHSWGQGTMNFRWILWNSQKHAKYLKLQFNSEVDGQHTCKTFAHFLHSSPKRLVKGCVLSAFLLLFLNAVIMLCSAWFQKTGFLSQKAATKASNQRLHILTSKGYKMAAVSMKHWNDLTWFQFCKICFWKFLGCE